MADIKQIQDNCSHETFIVLVDLSGRTRLLNYYLGMLSNIVSHLHTNYQVIIASLISSLAYGFLTPLQYLITHLLSSNSGTWSKIHIRVDAGTSSAQDTSPSPASSCSITYLATATSMAESHIPSLRGECSSNAKALRRSFGSRHRVQQ